MYLVHIAMEPTPAAALTNLDSATTTDLLWALAEPEDRIEHVYIQKKPDAMELSIFVHQESQEAAEETAHRFCRRVLRTAPALHGWQIASPAP